MVIQNVPLLHNLERSMASNIRLTHPWPNVVAARKYCCRPQLPGTASVLAGRQGSPASIFPGELYSTFPQRTLLVATWKFSCRSWLEQLPLTASFFAWHFLGFYVPIELQGRSERCLWLAISTIHVTPMTMYGLLRN